MYFETRHIENFFKKVRSEITPIGECWIWTAAQNEFGYGRFGTWANGRTKVWLAHRWAYEWLIGPIPTGLTLDHLCRNRACVNPAHLEPVTNRENLLRGDGFAGEQSRRTHCPEGHLLSGDNLYVYHNKRGSTTRQCRACRRRQFLAFKGRQADAAAA